MAKPEVPGRAGAVGLKRFAIFLRPLVLVIPAERFSAFEGNMHRLMATRRILEFLKIFCLEDAYLATKPAIKDIARSGDAKKLVCSWIVKRRLWRMGSDELPPNCQRLRIRLNAPRSVKLLRAKSYCVQHSGQNRKADEAFSESSHIPPMSEAPRASERA